MNRSDVVIASRSYDYTYENMQKSVASALQSMNVDYLDLFLLHEQESALTLKGHREAIRYLEDAREAGVIKQSACRPTMFSVYEQPPLCLKLMLFTHY